MHKDKGFTRERIQTGEFVMATVVSTACAIKQEEDILCSITADSQKIECQYSLAQEAKE